MHKFFRYLAVATLLFLFGSFSNPPKQEQYYIIKDAYWTIKYSKDLKQPIKVNYTVLCNGKSTEHFSREGLTFYTEPNLVTSTDIDYANNVYDKGHMAPAMAFSCNQVTLKKTFSYTNCALQHQSLNRGAWKTLELQENDLSTKYKVTVEILVKFSKVTRLPSGTAIPTHFQKTIYLNDKPWRTYVFPNQAVENNPEKFLIKKY